MSLPKVIACFEIHLSIFNFNFYNIKKNRGSMFFTFFLSTDFSNLKCSFCL